jgi:3-methylcrotonyl-CoA carboxylase beta subunit
MVTLVLLLLLDAGVADHFAEDDAHALEIARSIMAGLNIPPAAAAAATDSSSSGSAAQTAGVSETVAQEPLFGPDDMGSVIPTDPKRPFDVRKVTHHTIIFNHLYLVKHMLLYCCCEKCKV